MADQQPSTTSASDPTTSSTSASSAPPTTISSSSEIPTLRPQRQKPSFRLPTASDGQPSLSDRLKSFLPQMAAANKELAQLEKEGKLEGKRYEDVEEGKEFVEMELGLGVLEAKGEGESESESSEDSSEDSSDEDEEDGESGEERTQMPFRNRNGEGKERTKEEKEQDVLGKLMGLKRGKNRDGTVGIQEVGE